MEPPTNLPVIRDPLIGREHELGEAQRLLLRDDVGLLTMTGAGGSGKTRLALAVARAVLGDFGDGVFLVSLGALTDHRLIAASIARTLGLQDLGDRPPEQALSTYLRTRRLLLLVDNVEHVLDGAPLTVPAPDSRPEPAHLLMFGAIALFTRRARRDASARKTAPASVR